MGRKIPAKKHRGVKDPAEQQARRLQSIKGKINAPPKDPDDQPVPRSLTRLFAFQDKLQNNTIKKKNKPKITPTLTSLDTGVGKNPLAHLKKLPGESGRGFSLRINSAIKALNDPSEQDYQQDLETEDVKGEQMAAYRARRRRKRGRGGKPASTTDSNNEPGDKLTRAKKLALKKNAKKEKAAEDARAEVVYERVAFGDVASAPPALPVRPRRAPVSPAASRPGCRDLLLNAMLPSNSSSKRVVPPAELLRRERARLDVVAAYREHKKITRLNAKKK